MDIGVEVSWSERKSREYPRHMDEGLTFAVFGMRSTAKALGGQETDWELLQGKTVLDLACGSRRVPRLDRSRSRGGFPPYYCLLCAKAGADVWGVDIFDCDPKDEGIYHHITADIIQAVLSETQLSGIPGIAGLKFDVIHSLRFADDNFPPDVIDQLKMMHLRSDDLLEKIQQQSKELLKPGGVFVTMHKVFKI